jgi:gamma-glutamylcyclotransferase (GGCT)/AIG2-like uncharacterized protein YtfP
MSGERAHIAHRDGPPRLFAYGTLQPDRLRWSFVAPFALGHHPADVPGRLYDSGFGWPVAVFDDGPTLVPGTLIDLDPSRLVDALQILDEVEATATDLMARIEVTTSEGPLAWSYTCVGSTAGMTPIARWTSSDER